MGESGAKQGLFIENPCLCFQVKHPSTTLQFSIISSALANLSFLFIKFSDSKVIFGGPVRIAS